MKDTPAPGPRTVDRLERDGLIEFGVAVADLQQKNPQLHSMVQPFLATAIDGKLDAALLMNLLLDHIEYDSSHPLYLWVMEVRLKMGLSETETVPPPSSTPSIEIVAVQTIIGDSLPAHFSPEPGSRAYRPTMETIPEADLDSDDAALPPSERPTLLPEQLPENQGK